MNYLAIYSRIIGKARERVLSSGYEKHHIVPRCMGGDDSRENIVRLSYREHFLAHLLLVKIHPNAGALAQAAYFMCGKNGFSGSRRYQRLRELSSKYRSERQKEKPRPSSATFAIRTYALGKTFSGSHRLALSVAHKGKRPTENTRKKLSAVRMGRKTSEETRQKLIAALKGRVISPGNKSKSGQKNSEETRKRISLAQVGKKHGEEWGFNVGRSQARITDDQVREIRSSYVHRKVSFTSLGQKYGLSPSCTLRIIKKETYRWVD